MPRIQEKWLENQLVFGKPSSDSTKVTYCRSYSFDQHLSKTDNPAILKVNSTTAHHKSLQSDAESKDDKSEMERGDNKRMDAQRHVKKSSCKISRQNLKHLEKWNKVIKYNIFSNSNLKKLPSM